MLTLKSIAVEAIPTALAKAQQYRRLHEPNEAESICRDILAVMPEHQEALRTLLLALTDKFADYGLNPSFEQAGGLVANLDTSYARSYFSGILFERRAKYHLRQGGPGAGTTAYNWLAKAMVAFDAAMKENDVQNQDAVLRWNSCARIINGNPEVHAEEGDSEEMLLDTFETPH